MHRDPSYDILLGFLAINRAIGDELRAVRRLLQERGAEAKYNPNWRLQPRAPSGTPEGGQWIDGGVGRAPTRERRRQPRNQRPRGRLAAPTREERDGRGSIPLRLLSSSPLVLAAPLYGDTPRPTRFARSIPGAPDLVLVVVDSPQANRRFASFQRVIRPERRTPLSVFGMDTGLQNVEPAELEPLDVEVTIEGDDVTFDTRALVAEYGREIPGVTDGSEYTTPRPVELVPLTPEERRLVENLRKLGATPLQIIAAQQNLRHSEDDEALESELGDQNASPNDIAEIRRELRRIRRARDRSGVAHSSTPLPNARRPWLRGTHRNAGLVPEEVAAQLRGRTFSSPRAFKRAFWRAVANTPTLADQFTARNRRRMQRGRAPIARKEQRHGNHVAYILHHSRPISRGGERYDMSNIVVVTPRMHVDILDRRIHFRPPEDSNESR